MSGRLRAAPPPGQGVLPTSRTSSASSFFELRDTSSQASRIKSKDGLPAWRPKSAGAQMASLLAQSRARVRREEAGDAESRPRTGPAWRTDRLSAARRETLRLEREAKESVRQAGRAASLRAMLRFAIPPNRPTLKEVLGMTDDEYERACEGQDFDWEVGRPGEFCCVCEDPWLRRGRRAGAGPGAESYSCTCLGDGDPSSSDLDSSRLPVEHGDSSPGTPDLRYGSGFEVPRPHRYHRMLRRPGGDAGQPHGDHLCQLFAECASWLRDELSQDPGEDKDLEPHRLCQPLVLERDEGARLAVDVHEMRTVPHETALRAFALYRSQREAAHRALRRSARARAQPPARAAHHNVAFLRCVPRGDPAYYKPPPAASTLVVKQPPELVDFDKVWRPHVLALRITKRFCRYLEAEHPLVPRPAVLVRAGLLQPQDAGMLPPAPPLPRKARRPPPVLVGRF